MPRKQPRSLSKQERQKYYKELAAVIASLENPEQVERFLIDLLSETEMLMLARRIRIASLLLEGASYTEIVTELGTGPSTIAQVHHWLQKDNADLTKIKKQLAPIINKKDSQVTPSKTARQEYARPGTMAWMRQRYPVHFLLFNIFSGK